MYRPIFSILLCFLLPFVVSAQYPDLAVSNIDSSLLKHAHSVVRYDDMVVDVREGQVIYTFNYAVTVLNKKHEEKLVFNCGYSDGYQEIKNINLEVLDREGNRIKKVKAKEIEDRYAEGIEMISDRRFKYFHYQTGNYPVTFLTSYTYTDKSPYYIFGWWLHPGYNTAVENSTCKIVKEPATQIQIREQLLKKYHVQNPSAHNYEVSMVKPLRKEKYSPSFEYLTARIEIFPKIFNYRKHKTEIVDWAQFSQWEYEELYAPQQNCELDNLRKDLDSYITNPEDKLKTAEEIYRYVQKNTRYVLVSLDDGGYVPLETNTVHTKNYGDCKALSFYYKTLLDAYGVQSNIVSIMAGTEKPRVDTSIVTPTIANHVITRAKIDGKYYWNDCTSTTKPFNYLGGFNDDRLVTIMGSENESIARTPKYPSKKKYDLNIGLDSDGNLSGILNLQKVGLEMDYSLRKLPAQTRKENEDYHKKEVFKSYKDVTIDSFNYKLDTLALTFVENYKFSSSKVAERLGDYLSLPINQHKMSIPKLPKDKKRTWDIEFKRTKEYEVVTEFNYPVSFVIHQEFDVELNSDYGNYSWSMKSEAGKTIVTRKFTLLKGYYQPKEYKKLKSFFDKARKAEKTKLTINTKS